MPNWCSNSLSICGPELEVRAIADKLKTKDEDGKTIGKLTDFMPQPTDAAGELIGGCDWQYDNWGTKWGDCDTELSDEDYTTSELSTVSMFFMTPWGPADGLLTEISRLFPNVSLDNEYEEAGMAFFGIARYKGGAELFNENHDYDTSKGILELPDGWTANFDTDYDDPEQDPYGTLEEAIHSAQEHLWTTASLTAPIDSPLIES